MTDGAKNSKKFCVVQFIALPFEGIDDYVCVPEKWVVIRRKQDQKVVVAYPNNEDRFVTRDRVKAEEDYSDYWRFWTAEIKYQSDTFEDADFWIATRNDNGPLEQQNSSLNDTPSTSALNKKLRSSKQKSTPKSKEDTPEMTPKPYQIARKPLPRTTIKRTASDEYQLQLETKRAKKSTTRAAEPTGAVSQSAFEEPGCSSTLAPIEDEPLVIDVDENDHSQQDQQSSENDNSENRLVIDMTAAQNHLQDNGDSSSNFQPQITSVQSLATTSNSQVSSKNGPSTSQYKPESIATRLYEKMKGKPSLVAKGPAIEKKMRLENIMRNVAILLKNPPNSSNQNQPRQPTIETSQFIHPGDIPISSQEIRHMARFSIERAPNAFENPRAVIQNSQRSTEAQRRDPRLRPAINIEHPPIGREAPVVDPSNRIDRPLYGFNAAERLQRLLDQAQCLPPSAYRRPVAVPTLPTSSRSTPLPQEAMRNTPSPLFSNLSDSIQRGLLAPRRNFPSHEEELQRHRTRGSRIIETHPDEHIQDHSGRPICAVVRNRFDFQDDIDRSPSAPDSGIGMDHDGNSYHEIPAEEPFVETTNNVNHSQSDSRFISQQQMKDQFAIASTQMGSTLNYMANVLDNLQTSILKTAASYQTLMDTMERFNSPENSGSQASTSRNVAQEDPLIAEEREIAANRSANSNDDQNRNDVVNAASERNPNSTSQLYLPPDYSPNDTRWTLKHREHIPGLVELMPHSNIYVNYEELKYCEQTSSNCPSLARRILQEVFNKKALSVCSSMTEKGHDYSIYPEERPKLDEHGSLVLLNYILEHGLQRGWNTGMQAILKGLHDKVREIRFRFGVMSRC